MLPGCTNVITEGDGIYMCMHFILSKMKKYTERELTLLTKKKKKSPINY